MNAPLHFKQQLADELNVRAASLPAPTGRRATAGLRAPRRRLVFTVGAAVTAAVAVAVSVPLASGSHSGRTAAGTSVVRTPQAGASTSPAIVNADYSLKSGPNGTVTVELFDAKGIPGLQAALKQAGVPAAVLAVSASCHATIETDGSSALRKVLPHIVRPLGPDGQLKTVIVPSAIPKGEYLLFSAMSNGPDAEAMGVRLVRRIPSCV